MRVAIVHPWFPQYRKAFFDKLLEIASGNGIQIDIFHGDPPPEWQERGDSVREPYAMRMKTRFLRIGAKNLVYKSPSTVWKRGPYDVLILEQAVRNLETYAFLLHRSRTRIAFWGHGKTYTTPPGRIQELIKQFLTRRGKWFFSYTEGGAAAVTAAGFPADRVTIVQNSVDSTGLRASVVDLNSQLTDEFSHTHDLKGKTGLFIGGLDGSKRLDFLIEAADLAHQTDSDFRLLIAGGGSLRENIQRAADSRSWLSYLGPLFGQEKAIAIASADVLLMPGRVGLVAVDSFSTGKPILTTNWPFHAPEFEYLIPGKNALVVDNNIADYAAGIVNSLNNPELLQSLQDAAWNAGDRYTIDQMASNFLEGILSLQNEVDN